MINEKNIQVVFKYFDIDGDGVITKEELKKMCEQEEERAKK